MAQDLIQDLQIKIQRLESKNKALEMKLSKVQGQSAGAPSASNTEVEQLRAQVAHLTQQLSSVLVIDFHAKKDLQFFNARIL